MKTKKKTTKRVISLKKKVNRRLKLTFIPHAGNQYRPHLVRRYGLASVLMVVVVLLSGYNFTTTGSVLGVQQPISPSDLLTDTNLQRTDQHLPALRVNPELSQAAFMKANDMFANQYWAHVSPSGVTPWYWFTKVGYNYDYAGENLAKNFTTAGTTVAAWMASPKHRANILDTHYTDVGFAVVDGTLDGQHTTLIVALYGQTEAHVAVAGASIVPPLVSSTQVAYSLSPISRLGVALQSSAPAMLGSVVLLLFAAVVALGAQAYRRRLPLSMRRSWRYHHGLYKAVGLTSLAVMIVGLYSGGQI